MKRKKPNYKLRRAVAKTILVLLILLPIILINKTKISHAPLYLENMKYSKMLDSLFSVNYSTDEARNILEKLKKKKLIDKLDEDFITALDDKGYNHNSINYIILNFSKTEITKMINKKYDADFEEYITLDFFNYEKYNRYVKYQKANPTLPLDEVVVRVTLNIDTDPYDDAVEEKDPNSITALVNKHRYISKEYVPDDLVNMEDDYANNSYGVKEVRKETYEQFKKMVDAAKKENIVFYAESAYRDYEYQDELYNEYVLEYGQEKADTFAARAGFSEHQLGTTLDLANIWTLEEGDPEYKWIDKNGYKYGFIFRYKKSQEDVTGYEAEGWHIRYVGVEAATIIHKKGITFDEYWLRYVSNKKSSN